MDMAEYKDGTSHIIALFALFAAGEEAAMASVHTHIEATEADILDRESCLRRHILLLAEGVERGNWPWMHNAPPISRRKVYGPREPRDLNDPPRRGPRW